MQPRNQPEWSAMTPLSSEALVGPVIDASLDAVVIADLAGVILRVNPAAHAIFGHPPGALVGRTIGEMLVPAHLRAAHDRGMARHVATGERKVLGQRLELEARHADGHSFPVEIQIEEIEQGSQRVYAAFIRDLTERRAMEREVARSREQLHQREKHAALGALLGGVAHELNNPLAVVIGRAAILEEVLAGTSEERAITKLREAANRCHRIVRTFLAMARDAAPRPGRVHLPDLLAGALEFAAYALREAGISVTTRFDPAVAEIDGDHDQLVQAFVGLIMNARQALAEVDGPRQLEICTLAEAGAITITIADSGPGMSEAVRARAFEPFFTTRAFGEGGGHGLAIARGIFEGHGGSIDIAPPQQAGCTIRVTLPARAKDPTP